MSDVVEEPEERAGGGRIAMLERMIRAYALAKSMRTDSVPAQVEKNLFLGAIGAAYNKVLLKELGITHVVSVLNWENTPHPEEFRYLRVAIPDTPAAKLSAHWDQCIGFIDEGIANGGSVLVHCFAGRSRSPTVVIAYLMKRRGMRLSDALAKVQKVRPEACPNLGFMQQLADLDQELSGDDKLPPVRVLPDPSGQAFDPSSASL